MRRLLFTLAGLLFIAALGEAQNTGLIVRDEGAYRGIASRAVDCVGAGVTCTVTASSGTWTVNVTAGGGSFSATETEVDFGSTPTLSARFVVVDAGVSGTSKIVVQQAGAAATGRNADENDMDKLSCNATPAAGTFTLNCAALNGPIAGKFKVWYAIG